jgi:hypothetical protein
MYKRSFLVLQLLFLLVVFVNSQNTQSLILTKEFKNAFAKQTRNISGKPGNNYWQNMASYNIVAELFPQSRTLIGKQSINYINNSPDSLDRLVFNLYQDIFKKGTARDWDIGSTDLHDGVLIWNLIIDGIPIDLNSGLVQRNASILMVNLMNKLAPNKSIKIEMEWKFQLPAKRTIRMGTYHDSNFMVAYWFPRVAVYDDIVGWNTTPYVGNCEFYNDFSDFEVRITLPSDYLVWSTAPLYNSKEIFQNYVLEKIDKASKNNEVVSIISQEDYAKELIFKTNEKREWIFKMKNVVDFAFAASSSYLWDATSIQSGKNRVLINAVYKSDSKDFKQVAEISRNTIDFFTNTTPKIPFPFPQITIFNGRGGMEYPGMVNDGDGENLNGTLYVTSHEIGHSYFPFNTGLNEQRYAWMDEGLITYFPRKFVDKYSLDSNYLPYADLIQTYNRLACSFAEIPLMLPSFYTGSTYRFQAYTKPAIALLELEKYIGVDTFNIALQEFTNRWAGKHPIPFDFFFTFNQVVAEDLSWFWKPWFFEMTYADLALKIETPQIVKIINKGGNPVAIYLEIIFEDDTKETRKIDASIWKNNKQDVVFQFYKPFKSLKLNTTETPDAFPEDNIWVK